MLIEELNRKRIPESHNKIKKSGTTFGYNLKRTIKTLNGVERRLRI